jgi:lipoprotein-anchoring transpeptidase ErfK/SrfK
LAFALASPACAETGSGASGEWNGGTPAEAEATPGEPQPTEAKPAEAKPNPSAAQAKPKPAETKPEAKPNPSAAEAKPKPAETKPAEAKPKPSAAQAKPKPAETKPAEANPSAEQPKSDSAKAAPGSEPKTAPEDSAVAAEPSGSQILVNIDKSQQQMTVFVDGLEKYTWPVSTGKRGYSTPSGTYTATSMNEIWYSKEWDNAPMPHAVFFMKDGHAIHGSYEVKALGTPASHGCVRLAPKNATLLYDLVKKNGLKNTQVVLVGTTPGGEAKVAAQPAYPEYGGGPWPGYGRGYYPPPRYQQPRRGLFGRWFQQPYGGPQGYYRPPRGYYPPGY